MATRILGGRWTQPGRTPTLATSATRVTAPGRRRDPSAAGRAAPARRPADRRAPRRGRPRPSATARTRCAPSASATAPPTPTSSPAGRTSATSSTRSSAGPPDLAARGSSPTDDDPDRGRRRRRGRRRGRPGPVAPADVDQLGRELGAPADGAGQARDRAAQPREHLALPRARRRQPRRATATRLPTDVQMRIVEAQESERSRLAQEVHDGPAQALSNAIFQVEYIERVIDTRPARSPGRSCASCATCSGASSARSGRSSASSARRSSTSSGLDGAISDAIGRMTALTGLAISDGARRRRRTG